MAKLIRFAETPAGYREMLAALLPRGPIWSLLNADIFGLMSGLALEAVRFHNRVVDLMLEAFPSTTVELLDEWEDTYGLPLCDEAPTTVEGRQAALAGRVAAIGGQSRAYFIGVARQVVGSGGLIYIEENPDGVPFRVSENRVGDRLNGIGSRSRWILHLPLGTDEDLVHIVDCLVQRFKPAHTSASVVADAIDGEIGP